MTEVHSAAVVHADAQLGVDVQIGPFSVIGPHVTIGDRTRVMPHVFLDGWTTIGRDCTIFPFASVGAQSQDLKYKGGKTFVEVGDGTTLREYVTVNAGTAEGEATRIGSRCHIMAYCHAAHGSKVGNGVIMANGASLSGEVLVEDEAVIGGMTGVHQFTRIGRLAMVGGMSRITQDVPPFMLVEGNPAETRMVNQIGLQRHNFPEETQAVLKKAFKILFREGLSTRQALDRIRTELAMCPELEHLLGFIEASQRGIIK
jgi:UDP-N-acetylglucosamine acyltransferase